MARRIQDKILDSKDARRKLQPRAKPYWRSIERGLHLGYRRLRDVAGPWIARRYLGNQRYDEQAIGIADDLSAADGLRVLDYWQVAMEAATCPGCTRHERSDVSESEVVKEKAPAILRA